MSFEDGINAQSSRLYFKKKDHKAIYGSGLPWGSPGAGTKRTGFHHALYMQGKDPDRYDVIWRRMYPDLYFWFTTQGYYDWSGFSGICYPKAKVLPPSLTNRRTGNCCGENGKFWIGTFSDYADTGSWHFSSEDKRLQSYRDGRGFFPFRYFQGPYGAKNGFFITNSYGSSQYSNYDYYFVTIKPDKLGLLCDFDELIKLELSVPGNGSLNLANSNNGKHKYGYYYHRISESTSAYDYNKTRLFYQAFDCDTKELSEVVQTDRTYRDFGSQNLFANDKVFIPAYYAYYNDSREITNQRITLIELNGTNIIYHVMPGLHRTVNGIGMKYSDGTYYIYLDTRDANTIYHTLVYATKDFSSYTSREVSGTITLNHISDGSTYDLIFGGTTTSPRFYPRNIGGIQFFKNSKLYDAYETAFHAGIPSNWGNSAIVYLDNPWLEYSENAFYFKSSDWYYGVPFTGQEMEELYYMRGE